MKISRFAWRNLWRRKRRTIITALSIGFGVTLSVTFTGTGDYGYTKMINTGASMGMGHITVEPLGYNLTPSLDKKLKDTDQIRNEILEIPGITDAIVRITGQAMFASASKSIGGMFMGIDPAQESEENNLLLGSIVEGELFEGPDGRGVVVGSRMAGKLNLGLGKKIVYTTTDVNGEIVSEIARVTGIFRTGVDEVDGAFILLPINSVRKTLHYDANDATLIAVIINDQRHAEKMSEKIDKIVGNPEIEVLSWKKSQPDLAGIISMDRSSNYIIQVLIGLLIAAGILNTLLMGVLERTREFGVMMAVGMSPGTLFRLIITESFWLAVLGLLAGIIITTPWYAYLYNVGIDFSAAIGGESSAGGVLIDPVLKIRIFRESVIAILLGVFGLTILSGIYPAWKAGRVPPVESLKTI
ncbi:MAG: ABC transporter permease [Deltaproteobacteria bacterium]|nr:ABC transporter permease [Deltaproteobacteria bacterium]